MWHASVRGRYGSPQWRLLEEIARRELNGVGDAGLGEWVKRGEEAGVLHLRRRLTGAEMRTGDIEGVYDVRGTPEFTARISRMRPFLFPAMRDWPDEAFP